MGLLGWTDYGGDSEPVDVYAEGGGLSFRRRTRPADPNHEITGGWLGGLLNPSRDDDAPDERRRWFSWF
jgi:hypothetical protein